MRDVIPIFTTFNDSLVMFIDMGQGQIYAVAHDGALLSDDDIYNIARERSTSPEALKLLSKHANVYVRMHVARNLSTPQETLVELSRDKNDSVKWCIAFNNNMPTLTRR